MNVFLLGSLFNLTREVVCLHRRQLFAEPVSPQYLLTLFLVLSIGCDSATAPVKVDVARDTLATVMDNWKNGMVPDDLAPEIIVQDMDWSAGAKLLNYEIMDGDKPINSNLYAKVELNLRLENGEESTKTATYVISTTPRLTVFRDMLK